MSSFSPLSSIVWISHERPDLLVRSVNNFISNLPENSWPELKLTLIDSSTEHLTHHFDSTRTVNLFHEKKRTKWIHQLCEEGNAQGLDPEIIRFALESKNSAISPLRTTGANRNVALLLTVNQTVLSVDDDVLLRVLKKKSTLHSTQFQSIDPSPSDPYHTQFYENALALENDLSKSTATALSSFLKFNEDLLNQVEPRTQSPIVLTSNGIFGDSGFSSPRMIFALNDSTLTELLKAEGKLNTALNSRFIWRETPQPTLQQITPFMSPCFGFKNTLDLPPFFPYGRNQDGAYPYALHGCLQSPWIAHTGYSVFHQPVEARSYDGTLNQLPFRINDLIALIWTHLLRLKANENNSYEVASRHFENFAGASQANFIQNLNQALTELYEGRTLRIQEQIKRFEQTDSSLSAPWRKIANQEIALMSKTLRLSEQINPIESPNIDITRKWLLNYSRLLQQWKAMRGIAKGLPVFTF